MIVTSDIITVIVTILVGLIASYVAASTAKKERDWVTGGALTVATGMWTIYFVGMLAWGLPVPISHSIPIALHSLLLVVVVAGFVLCTQNQALRKRAAAEPSQASAPQERQSIGGVRRVEEIRSDLKTITNNVNEAITLHHDVSALKQALEQLDYLAQHDALTGLPNRNLFRTRLEVAMARARRNGQMLALMFLDLGRFKEINDTLGHGTGDAVLQAVAKLLTESLRETDTIARLSGDEFTLILENIAHADQATMVAEKILQVFSAPLIIEKREFYVTPSIGITLYPGSAEDIDTLLKTADVAMHHAKEEGRDTYEFYTPAMKVLAAEDLDMENLLRHALKRHELTLHYQPKVGVKSGLIVGVEALVRWNSEELGSVPPGKFIPLAEKTGLIGPIGEWVLRTACAQSRAWQDQGLPPLLMSVNLSPRQFRQKNLVEMVAGALRDTGLDPRLVELEITEGMIMRHPDKAIAILEELHQLGVQLSVDDFGTGYSSLSYLKRFPVQKLKIDQSFVRDITVDGDDAGIVTAVVAMAKSLALEVIAEGVETKEQLDFLAKLDCEEYQGHHFSRPVPAEEFARLLLPSALASAA